MSVCLCSQAVLANKNEVGFLLCNYLNKRQVLTLRTDGIVALFKR